VSQPDWTVKLLVEGGGKLEAVNMGWHRCALTVVYREDRFEQRLDQNVAAAASGSQPPPQQAFELPAGRAWTFL